MKNKKKADNLRKNLLRRKVKKNDSEKKPVKKLNLQGDLSISIVCWFIKFNE